VRNVDVTQTLETKRVVLQAAATWVVGYVVMVFLRGLGRRELARIVRFVVIVSCAIAVVKVAIGVTSSVAEFFDPFIRFMDWIMAGGKAAPAGGANSGQSNGPAENPAGSKLWDFLTRMPGEGGK
jgi:hypothetical protein